MLDLHLLSFQLRKLELSLAEPIMLPCTYLSSLMGDGNWQVQVQHKFENGCLILSPFANCALIRGMSNLL